MGTVYPVVLFLVFHLFYFLCLFSEYTVSGEKKNTQADNRTPMSISAKIDIDISNLLTQSCSCRMLEKATWIIYWFVAFKAEA